MSQGLFDFDSDPPSFDGVTFDYTQDFTRLIKSLDRVAHLMRDGTPRTLKQIAEAVGSSEAGVSARLRDLRKERFAAVYGIGEVHSERLEGGLWIYYLTATNFEETD